MFLSTTGDVLNAAQQAAFERFIRRGGGFVGVHSATDTEYDWPFYGALVGRLLRGPSGHSERHRFRSKIPGIRRRRRCRARGRAATSGTTSSGIRAARVTVLATLDERTYSGGTMAPDHPIMWSHTYEGGRVVVHRRRPHVGELLGAARSSTTSGKAILWAAGAI